MAATESAESRNTEAEPDPSLSARQLAVARSRAYDLLGQLYLKGITADNLDQAVDRAGAKSGNKGFEAALGAIEMADLMKKF